MRSETYVSHVVVGGAPTGDGRVQEDDTIIGGLYHNTNAEFESFSAELVMRVTHRARVRGGEG